MLTWETHRPIFHFDGYGWKSRLSDGSEAVLFMYERGAEIHVYLEIWTGHTRSMDKSERIGFSSSDTVLYKFAQAAKKWAEDLILSPMDILAQGLRT